MKPIIKLKNANTIVRTNRLPVTKFITPSTRTSNKENISVIVVVKFDKLNAISIIFC